MHVGIGYPTKENFDELVNALAGLTREIGDSRLQRGVDTDRGVRHVSIVPRRVTHTEDSHGSQQNSVERVERGPQGLAIAEIRLDSSYEHVDNAA